MTLLTLLHSYCQGLSWKIDWTLANVPEYVVGMSTDEFMAFLDARMAAYISGLPIRHYSNI